MRSTIMQRKKVNIIFLREDDYNINMPIRMLPQEIMLGSSSKYLCDLFIYRIFEKITNIHRAVFGYVSRGCRSVVCKMYFL